MNEEEDAASMQAEAEAAQQADAEAAEAEAFDENAVVHRDLPGGRAAKTVRVTEYDRLKAMKDRIVDEQRPRSNFQKVGQFNDACDCHREPKPGMPPAEVVRMRLALITEELDELVDACQEGDIVEIADALADLEYVVHGAAHTFRLDSQPVFDEVHRSNMAKVGADGKVIRRADGKILKPEGWTRPDVAGVLAKQGYVEVTA